MHRKFLEGARKLRRALFFFSIVVVLSSCGGEHYFFHPADSIKSDMRGKGWNDLTLRTEHFVLASFVNGQIQKGMNLHIYIEGDGNAFDSQGRVTDDPTPLKPTALELAVSDQSPATVYLARPCQYWGADQSPSCSRYFWTSGRFSEEVVDSMNTAVTKVVRWLKPSSVTLIGFSGGGAVATLVAARRTDIANVITVAGTLDPDVWMDHHELPRLRGSLNPKAFASRLGALKQAHIVGADDKIMPRAVADSYMAALSPHHKARVISVPGYDHQCCWAKNWPDLLAKALAN